MHFTAIQHDSIDGHHIELTISIGHVNKTCHLWQVSSILKHNVAEKNLNRRCSSAPNKQAFYLYVASPNSGVYIFTAFACCFSQAEFRIQRCACKESASEWPCLYDALLFPTIRHMDKQKRRSPL